MLSCFRTAAHGALLCLILGVFGRVARAQPAQQQLDRARFVREVLAANPSVESARQSFRAAAARVRQAGPWSDPMLELGVAPLSLGSRDARLGYEVSVSQELPWFGKRGLERDAASADSEAARADYEGMRRDLALTAATLYDQYYVATRALEINAHHGALMRAMRDAALAQLEIGRGSAQDSVRAEVELARLEQETLTLQSQREVLIAQMNELMHRAPESALPAPAANLTLPSASVDADARLEGEARANRAEITAAKQRARAAQTRAERAARDAYPDLTVSTSYNSMWDMPEHRWMVGIGLSLPLQAERRAGARDEANAMRAQYESESARASDHVTAETFVAARRVREATALVRSFDERLLPLAQRQLELARAAFTASQTSLSELISAEKGVRDTELERERALADVDIRDAELERALGRIPGLDHAEAAR